MFLIFAVTVCEVEALYELFKKLSSTIFDDGIIHKVYFLFVGFQLKYKFASVSFDSLMVIGHDMILTYYNVIYNYCDILMSSSFKTLCYSLSRKNSNLPSLGTKIRRIFLLTEWVVLAPNIDFHLLAWQARN